MWDVNDKGQNLPKKNCACTTCHSAVHPLILFYLRSSEELLAIDVSRAFSLYSAITQKSGLKHQSLQTAGCHPHPLASKDNCSQLNIKLLVFQYKAKPQPIMLQAVSWKPFPCSWKIRKCCCMPFQAISHNTGHDAVHKIHSLPQFFFPFIQLLNLLVCFLAALFFCCALFWNTHSICRLHFVERVDWYNFHRHQGICLSSLESLTNEPSPRAFKEMWS